MLEELPEVKFSTLALNVPETPVCVCVCVCVEKMQVRVSWTSVLTVGLPN